MKGKNTSKFNFHTVTSKEVMKKIRLLNAKKSTGYDNIPAKLVKLGKESLVSSLTKMINKCIEESIFPDDLKLANIMPAYKAKDSLNKNNYRPISILPILSKIYESILNDQLARYCEDIMSNFLSAFRKRYSCQTILLKMIEDWKLALDNKDNIAAIFVDMSKAFDMISHEKLLKKLKCYNLSDNSLKLIKSYLNNRYQRVKIGNEVSDWRQIMSGVPQGSIIGPLLFNIYINDIFYVLECCELYNYADDNILSYNDEDVNKVIQTISAELVKIINWFKVNSLAANPDKFQCLTLGKDWEEGITFNVGDTKIVPSRIVKSLGISIDNNLNFNEHVTDICRSAARQVNVLKRIHKHLDTNTRMDIYRAFIMSNFNYCPLVWHFCSIENTRKLEKIQERALRFVYRDFNSTYRQLLDKGGLDMLYLKRLKFIAMEVFKIVTDQSPKYMNTLVQEKQDIGYNFRQYKLMTQPEYNSIRYGLNSFRYKAPKIWNSLPNDAKKAINLSQFKKLLKTWSGPRCYCTLCSKMIL